MAKTKGVKKQFLRKQRTRKMKAKGMKKVVANYLGKILNDVHLRTYGQEFADPSVVSQIMSHIPSAKTEYKNRLINALALNTRILAEQKAEIKRLEMSGLDGPARRTRSKAQPATNPVLEELRLEAYHTRMVIMRLQYLAQKIRHGETSVPHGYKDYAEFLKGDPGWDMERMAYVRRERPPGYENYDKLKAKAEAEAKAKAEAEAKAETKDETKAETPEDPVKLKKLALELYKKSSAMKAKAKADLIQMARNTDKESIDIMLENNFYDLTNKQLEAWIAKARIQANKK